MHLKPFWTTAALSVLLTTATAQATVYLIRHGEKPSDGSNGLSAQGQQRAQCLVNVFSSSSGYNIGYILAEQPKSDGSRERPVETVTPLANSLGLSVDTHCDRDDSDCVADAVNGYTGDGNILICWEHGQLTNIVEALGDDNAPEYPDSNFNLIWTDPADYTTISSVTNECCPGLDSC